MKLASVNLPSRAGQAVEVQPSAATQPVPVQVSLITVLWSRTALLLSASLITILTLGASPLTQYFPFAGAFTKLRSKLNSGMLRGSFVVQSWTPVMFFRPLVAPWQVGQPLSLACAPAVVWFAPVVKSTSSW